jgi:hypothetical protein
LVECPGAWLYGKLSPLVSPKIFEPIGRQFGISHGVLDVLVPHPILAGPLLSLLMLRYAHQF